MLRNRNSFVVLGSILVLVLLLLTDPELGWIQHMGVGASTLTLLISILIAILCVALLHYARKALLDYKSADFGMLLDKASRTPEGAGIAAVAVSIMVLAFAVAILAGILVTQ